MYDSTVLFVILLPHEFLSVRNIVTTTERRDICITQSIVGIQGVGLTVISEESKAHCSVDFTVVSSNGKESLYSSLHGGL